MSQRRVAAVALVSALAVALALALAYLARPPTRVMSDSDPDVTLECAASTRVGRDACLAWGDFTLRQGPPSFTFEMDDLTRLRIDRPLLGFGSPCEVAYFISRYPDDPAWMDEIPCIAAR